MTVGQVMTRDAIVMNDKASVVQAAKAMSERQIGAVVVMEEGRPCGIVTDRDITVRAVATGKDPSSTPIGDICTREIATVTPDQSIDDAVAAMKAHCVRRVLVMVGDQLAGIVSLGDLEALDEAVAVRPPARQGSGAPVR